MRVTVRVAMPMAMAVVVAMVMMPKGREANNVDKQAENAHNE